MSDSKGSFLKYVTSKNITIINPRDINENKIPLDEKSVYTQLDNICFFHKAVIGYNSIGNRLPNTTGKLVEEYKVCTKRLERELEKNIFKRDDENYPEIILQRGEEYLNRARKCINKINESDYLSILKRSMDRYEVCLGDTYYNNLWRLEGSGIGVVSLKNCKYDIVEVDAITLFDKLKSKGYNLQWQKLIKYYCEIEKLDKQSSDFILAAISYPSEFMKCFNKYYRKKISSETFNQKVNKAIKNDGKSLI